VDIIFGSAVLPKIFMITGHPTMISKVASIYSIQSYQLRTIKDPVHPQGFRQCATHGHIRRHIRDARFSAFLLARLGNLFVNTFQAPS
jgi:hypothetical protein